MTNSHKLDKVGRLPRYGSGQKSDLSGSGG